MVFIPQQPIFSRNADGHPCALDFRKLLEDIHVAFLKNGVQNPWVEEQLTLSLEEKLRNETMRETPLSLEEIDELLMSVLTASGYSDVAATFAEIHGVNPFRRFTAALAPWDDARLAHAISKGLPLTPEQVSEIVPACRDALRHLHIRHVSDTFIVELAIHLAHDGNASDSLTQQNAGRNPTPNANDGAQDGRGPQNAMTPRPAHDDMADELIRANIIRLCPIAPIFPHAQLSLSLKNFCNHFTDGWPAELAIAAGFPKTAHAILALLAETRHQIAREFPKLADSTAYVKLADYNDFIDDFYGAASKTERIAFDLAVRKILENMLVKPAPFQLKLSFR